MEKIIEIKDSKIITNILNIAFLTVAQQYNFTRENAPTFAAFINSDRIENSLDKGLKMYGYNMNEQIIGCAGFSYYKENIFL